MVALLGKVVEPLEGRALLEKEVVTGGGFEVL